MTATDVVVIVTLFAGAAALGYFMGRSRRRSSLPAGAKGVLAPPSSMDAAATPAPLAPAEGSEEPKAVATGADAPISKLSEDEVDDVDVTKVGAASSGRPQSPVRTIYQPPVQHILFDPVADFDEPPQDESMFLVHATAQTDTGLRRKRNEDSLLVLDSANLFVVADGMGGYRGGELASQLAVKAIGAAAAADKYEGPPHEALPREASELARAIQMANADIQEAAAEKPELEGMGTTICAARFSPTKARLHVAHVGDSRCYRLRDGVFKAMTADHTMADQGVSGPESAHLSRAVGIWPTMPIDVVSSVPRLGDVYLLCSDGLTKMLTDNVIGNVLRSEEDPKAAVARLVVFANSKGGKDNITVILVRITPPDWTPGPQLTGPAKMDDGSTD